MSEFHYIARELSGDEVTGVVSAANHKEALRQLASQSLFPVKVAPASQSAHWHIWKARRISVSRVAAFYLQLADLLRSGVPLLRSLELLKRGSSHARFETVISAIHDHVADGGRLAEAFGQHPKVFTELAVSIVRAGEEGGFLEDSLQRVSDFTQQQEEVKSQVLGALAYPAFLVTTGTIIVSCMLIFFVPKFEPIFERLSQRGELPWATTALMGFSAALGNYGVLIAIAFGVAIFLLIRYLRTDAGRLRLDHLRLSVRPFGTLARSLAISRFCRVLGTMLRNGVPLLRALHISKDATGNRVLGQAIMDASEGVTAGRTLAQPLAACGQFPDDVIEMITVGEESNNLENVLIQIADSMERKAQRRLALMVRLLEPIMLLIMAVVILFVVIALLLPIFQSSGMIG